jgi:hypothetical protein
MKRPLFQMTAVVKIKTNILCSVTFSDNLSVYVIMWKNITEPSRPQIITWRILITRWTPTATNKHSEYVKLNDFPLQQRLHKRTSVLRYTYIACLLRSGFGDSAGVLALFVLCAKKRPSTFIPPGRVFKF